MSPPRRRRRVGRRRARSGRGKTIDRSKVTPFVFRHSGTHRPVYLRRKIHHRRDACHLRRGCVDVRAVTRACARRCVRERTLDRKDRNSYINDTGGQLERSRRSRSSAARMRACAQFARIIAARAWLGENRSIVYLSPREDLSLSLSLSLSLRRRSY